MSNTIDRLLVVATKEGSRWVALGANYCFSGQSYTSWTEGIAIVDAIDDLVMNIHARVVLCRYYNKDPFKHVQTPLPHATNKSTRTTSTSGSPGIGPRSKCVSACAPTR